MQSSVLQHNSVLYFNMSKYLSTSFSLSYAIRIKFIVFTFIEPIDKAVPPIEFIKASNFLVSDNKRQQFDKTPTLSLIKKLLSFHFVLWSEHQRANSSSTNLLSLKSKLYVNPVCSC